jgi:hypothetical protein
MSEEFRGLLAPLITRTVSNLQSAFGEFARGLKAAAERTREPTRPPMKKLQRKAEDPWQLQTPPGTSEYTMHTDTKDGVAILVCTVGKTVLHYDARCVADLHAMLVAHGDWMELGGADEQKPAKEGTVEAWGRSPKNPIGGWYGLKKGLRGRFGVYVPPLMEALGLCELEHNAKNNRMRAK